MSTKDSPERIVDIDRRRFIHKAACSEPAIAGKCVLSTPHMEHASYPPLPGGPYAFHERPAKWLENNLEEIA